jgi:hypothetical protein
MLPPNRRSGFPTPRTAGSRRGNRAFVLEPMAPGTIPVNREKTLQPFTGPGHEREHLFAFH